MKTFKKDIADIDKAAHEADVQAERDRQLSAQLEVKSEPEPTIDIESEPPEIEALKEIEEERARDRKAEYHGNQYDFGTYKGGSISRSPLKYQGNHRIKK